MLRWSTKSQPQRVATHPRRGVQWGCRLQGRTKDAETGQQGGGTDRGKLAKEGEGTMENAGSAEGDDNAQRAQAQRAQLSSIKDREASAQRIPLFLSHDTLTRITKYQPTIPPQIFSLTTPPNSSQWLAIADALALLAATAALAVRAFGAHEES